MIRGDGEEELSSTSAVLLWCRRPHIAARGIKLQNACGMDVIYNLKKLCEATPANRNILEILEN